MPGFRSILTLGLLAGGCTPSPEGRWTGGCEVDGGLRVVVDVAEVRADDARPLVAEAMLVSAMRPGESASLTCDDVVADGATISMGACTGGWNVADGPAFPFSLTGELARAEPSDQLAGTCTLEGDGGALELWRTP